MKSLGSVGLAALLLVLSTAGASAKSITVNGVVTVAQRETGVEVAVFFDLTRSGIDASVKIDIARMSWQVQAMTSDQEYEFELFPIVQAWNAESVASGTTNVNLSENTCGFWTFEPADYERNGGGRIVFEMASLVQTWIRAEETNYGVCIVTSGPSAEDFQNESAVPVLTILYE